MVDAIGFNGASALLSSISCTSGATTTYFFPSGIYLTVIIIFHFNIFANYIDDASTNRFDCIWF